ncbi:MAG: hypothetical protein Ct9H300mP32_4500 [Verrucomicrobiota bacterium]|nr:MAG: hypothetical protein Ct9H300mP32_4500 [Verrucomicrobiota bacterium]
MHCRREPLDVIDVRLLQLIKELPGVRRECLDYFRSPSAKSVSNASDDLPEPLGPVITTSFHGESQGRFLRLCSLAPAIFLNPLATESCILNRPSHLAKRGSVRHTPFNRRWITAQPCPSDGEDMTTPMMISCM